MRDLFWIIPFFIGAVFVVSWIMPWVNRGAIRRLRQDVDALRREVARLREKAVRTEDIAEQQPPTNEMPIGLVRALEEAAAHEEAEVAAFQAERHDFREEESFQETPQEKSPPSQEKASGFEQQFGGRAFVWMGGLALVLAGYFMVKYSIETGLLSPAVRTVLGLIFGAGLLGGGQWVRTQPRFANGTRIAQALSGAGIADLYVCLFAATSLYHLVPQLVGFAGMAAVTVMAVLLSLRHGPPIAVLGLLGGFLTPALVGSTEPNAPLLFFYLYFVLTGMLVVIRRQGWWFMSVPAVLLGFAWVLVWMFGSSFMPYDALCLGVFLIASCASVAATTPRDKEDHPFGKALNYVTFAGSAVLMAAIAGQNDFGFLEWGLFGVLALGGIGLAFFDDRRYGFVPPVSMVVNAVMLMMWNHGTPQETALILSAFAALYVASGYILQTRTPKALLWSAQTAAAGLGYYLLGYAKIHGTPLVADIPLFWGVLALALSVASVVALQRLMTQVSEAHPHKQHMMAIYAGLATAFLSLGLTIELKREFLSVAFAGEVLALAWINTRVNIKALRYFVAALACVFGFLLVPQIVLLVQITVYSLVEAKLHFQDTVPIVQWPLFQLGVPAVCLGVGSWLLRRKDDDVIVRALETSTVALIGIMGYYLMRHAFHVDQNVLFTKAGFVERGAITNVLFLFGLGCLWLGRTYGRSALSLSGMVLSGVALFRIVYFDLMIHNPLWSYQEVGAWPILNALVLVYGLPIAWTWQARKESARLGKPLWEKGLGVFMLALGFTLVSFEVRQFFHGAVLESGVTSDAEIYTYSVVWLALAFGLLFVGALRQDKTIRVASLPVMLLTVGKVFLVDASALTGLWRVFSFFGLGLSLLALSWFYSRFVFSEMRGVRKP